MRVQSEELGDYICITDIAKTVNQPPAFTIRNWLRNRATVEFLGFWEMANNRGFKLAEFDHIKSRTGLNNFALSALEWVKSTGAIGIKSKSGRYGGTFTHFDIAVHFCNWFSAEFYVDFLKEFRRMREESLLATKWDLRRELAKGNYLIHTDAVRHNLVPVMERQTKKEGYRMASEADFLNEVVFGMKAREWRKSNPNKKGNIRDHASTEELHVLANLEALNAEFLEMGLKADERLWRLTEAKKRHMGILQNRKLLK